MGLPTRCSDVLPIFAEQIQAAEKVCLSWTIYITLLFTSVTIAVWQMILFCKLNTIFVIIRVNYFFFINYIVLTYFFYELPIMILNLIKLLFYDTFFFFHQSKRLKLIINNYVICMYHFKFFSFYF